MLKQLLIISFIFLTFLSANTRKKNLAESDIKSVIALIEKGFENNDVEHFSSYFDEKIVINLINGVNGYFSKNQAYHILQKFFKDYEVISCKIKKDETGQNQFSTTGEVEFRYRGKYIESSIYINLQKENNFWKISQITVN